MIGNRGAPPLAGRIDVAAATAGRAEHPRVDSAISAYRSRPGLAEERRTRGGGHAFRLRVRRQGDREPADGDLRCLRIVRHAGAGRFHGADAQPVRRLPGPGVRGCRQHRPWNLLFAKRLAGRRRDGRGRFRDSLFRGDQRLLRRSFLAAPHRPNGPRGPRAALASLVDELDWLLSFLAPPADLPSLELCREENAEAVAATVAALRASASTLAGVDERPDFQRIEVARDAVARALVQQIPELPPALGDGGFGSALEAPFRVRVISYSGRQVAGYALLASGRAAPELDELDVAGGDFVARPTRDTLLA